MNISPPVAIAIIPIATIIEPLIVHSGLLYINEDAGPTRDLLCKLKIIPDIARIIPMIIKSVSTPFILLL